MSKTIKEIETILYTGFLEHEMGVESNIDDDLITDLANRILECIINKER